MKKLTDEEIQALLESEFELQADVLNDAATEQLESYRSLFKNLHQEPEQGLPFNFAAKVTHQLKVKLKRRSEIRFNLLAALGIIFGLAAACGLLTLVDLNAATIFWAALLKFKWLLMLASVILLGSLMIDQGIVEEG